MKSKLSTIILLSLGLFFLMAIPVFAEDINNPFSIPGRIQGTGTYFEIKNSDYLNISLQSNEEISITLESVPKTISLTIEASSVYVSTTLTINGLEPNKTYYKYDNSYRNKTEFTTDQNGKYAFIQNLVQSHHVWLQEIQGTVFIPEDCSTYGTWDGLTSTCTLNQDLTEDIEITMDNITLDCNDHNIIGLWTGYGIYLNNKEGVTIKNCIVSGFSPGSIFFYYSSNNILTENTFLNNYTGIDIRYSNGNVITDNNISSNTQNGICLESSDSNTLTNNTVQNNYYGLSLYYSSNNILLKNTISNSEAWGFVIYESNSNTIKENTIINDGLLVDYSYQNIVEDNTVNSKPIIYFENKSDYTIDNADIGQLILVNCSNITVKNLELYSSTDAGIQLIETNNSQIINNKISNAHYGIYLSLSNFNTISGNEVQQNDTGINFHISSHNTLTESTISNNQAGIALWYSDANTFLSNDILNNGEGFHVEYSNDNTFMNNDISNNRYSGIYLMISSNRNSFVNNNILNNRRGIYLGLDCNNNKAYHNNFMANYIQVWIYTGIINFFDNGYPDGGNYWSDYDTPEEGCFDANSDGFCDAPYTFYGGEDRYPFMEEIEWEEIPEKWSFAIITDLHIGNGFLDYGSSGWDDDNNGQESKSPTKNLRKIVTDINSNKEKYNIAFVVVDGDFTNSAELSELNKAKEILDGLEISWIPLIGNHDIWPYYGKNPDPINREAEMAPEVDTEQNGTDRYFNNIFNPQYEKLKAILPNWYRENVRILNSETDPNHFSFFQNFYFDYNNYHFIGLDFAHRDKEKYPLKGAAAEGNLHNFASGTWDWFRDHLEQYYSDHPEEQERVILLAHHPFRKHYSYGFNIGFSDDELNTIDNFLEGYKDKIAFQFAGHTHDKKVTNFENIMTIVETQANVEAPVTRIVQIYPDDKIDYSQLLPEKMMVAEGNSPIDLEITDPDGLIINKQFSEIPGANYFEEDTDGDDELDDIIEIPERKMGEYQIRVIPEPGAAPEDTYSLEISVLENTFGYVPILLAENIPISETPTEPYLIESKEREITQITYTGELSGQYSDQVNLSAVLNDIDGNPLINETVIFEIGEQSISAITNESGIASAVLSLNQIPGKYYFVEVSFAGDEDYLPSVDSEDFEILKENAIINVVEKEGFAFDEIILEAEIKDDDGQTPLPDTEIEFKINNRTLGIVKIDDEGLATISWQVDLIPKEPTEDYLIEAIFAGNDYYQPTQGAANFVFKSAKWLKQDAILELEEAKTGNKKNDKEIDKIIWFINQSLNENLWLDASHLVFFEKGKCENLNLEKILDKDELDLEGIGLKCLKSGIVVFYYEKMAVKLMMPRQVFEPVIGKLVKADKLLAQVSLFDAQNTPVKNPKLQKIVENQIKKAKQEIQKGEVELQKSKPDKAVTRLAKSWLHSQLAIRFANL